MSSVINRCVYSQIQSWSLRTNSRRSFPAQFAIFLATSAFDIGITAGAAAAAAAVGAHMSNQPLTGRILHAAVIGGVVKAGSMASHAIFSFGLFGVIGTLMALPLLLAISFASNVVVVAAVASYLDVEAPTELLVAAVVASIPLCVSFAYYYGAFNVPITILTLSIDALGGFTFARMADNLGYPICTPSTAATAGAAFGTISTLSTTLLACLTIGHPRTIQQYGRGGGMSNVSTSGTSRVGWCGNRVYVNLSTREIISGLGVSGMANSETSGTVFNSAHGVGLHWDTGWERGHVGWSAWSSRDSTTTRSWSNVSQIQW
ncbi:hypothetical protein BDV12DRAFT_194531 [Aspergillus spectabilis]